MKIDGKELSNVLFWDVDESALDMDRDALFIIRRVVDRGSLTEVKAVWHYYGEEVMKRALVGARCLDGRSLAFFANQLGVPCESFRAFAGARQS